MTNGQMTNVQVRDDTFPRLHWDQEMVSYYASLSAPCYMLIVDDC
jgi:hypothetical protein